MTSLRSKLAAVLATTDPWEKAAHTRETAAAVFQGTARWTGGDDTAWPDPAHRDRPVLNPPGEMPRRGLGSAAGRAALLHAVAHIELNAIDLAIDMAGRFAPDISPSHRDEFIADWLKVADDEARHFIMMADRLTAFGSYYGELPAHDGLWQAAERTRRDLLARLAIAPLVLEARGLDVTPGMIARLERAGDRASADILRIIYDEEVGHVATGAKWFRYICKHRKIDPESAFSEMVRRHFPGGLKRPFNDDARARSDMPRDWYDGLAVADES